MEIAKPCCRNYNAKKITVSEITG